MLPYADKNLPPTVWLAKILSGKQASTYSMTQRPGPRGPTIPAKALYLHPDYGFFTMISAARSASALMVREGFTPRGVGTVAPSIT